jgi:hypothetical protein
MLTSVLLALLIVVLATGLAIAFRETSIDETDEDICDRAW